MLGIICDLLFVFLNLTAFFSLKKNKSKVLEQRSMKIKKTSKSFRFQILFFKTVLSDLRQLLATESPLKKMKNDLNFT